MRKDRKYYTGLYESYPDLVTVEQACTMLGGIGVDTVYMFVHDKDLFAYYIRGTYLIPKSCLIDFVFSKRYKAIKDTLNNQI